MLYLITYDLNGKNKNYEDLTNAIKELAAFTRRVKICESVWIIKTLKSSTEIFNKLEDFLDDDDALLVSELTGDMAWQLSDKISTKLETLL